MAVEVTLLTADAEGAGGDLVTESISPTGPVLMAAFITQGTIAQNPPISGCGLSWTLLARIADGPNFRALFLWLGTGTPTEGAITVSEDGNAWDSKSWLVAQVGGASESVIVAENLIAALSMDLEFPQAIAAGNGAFAVFSTSDRYALTPREGWANLLSEAVGVQGAANIAGAWRADGDTHAGGSFPGGSTRYGIAVELEAAGGASTAPTLSNASAQATGATTGSGSVDTDTGEGTLYWVVTTSSTAPSAAQVQAGTDENDTAAADSGSQAVIATGTQAITGGFTGLSAGTTYYAHYQHQDAAENDSAVASSSAFTTHSAITGDAAGTSSDSGTVTQTYSISGTVTSSGEAVEGALIYLIDQSSDSVIDTETTGADGTYSFTGLSAGTYHAAVEYEGFAAPSVSFIKLGGD